MQQEYIYHSVNGKPTEKELLKKKEDGWEPAAPDGVIGRALDQESNYSGSVYYFRKKN